MNERFGILNFKVNKLMFIETNLFTQRDVDDKKLQGITKKEIQRHMPTSQGVFEEAERR